MNNIIQFHIDHGYYVNVKTLSNIIGCAVNFPPNYIINQPGSNITYLIENNPLRIEVYDLEDGHEINFHSLKVTKSSARVLVLEDILLRTLKRKIAQCLILVDENNNKNIFDTLLLEMDDEVLELEKRLLLKFRELILGKVDTEIENIELAKGYRLVLDCFENGGL